MLIETNTFWSYVIDEPSYVINDLKNILTKKDYDVEKKEYLITELFQELPFYDITSTLRIPTGLIPYVLSKQFLKVEKRLSINKEYTKEDVLTIAREVATIVPSFEVRPYQLEAVLTSLNNFQSLVLSSVGSGKEQPVDIIIPTPTGLKRFGDLKIGDLVFGKNGKEQHVLGIYPQGKKQVYTIHFKNGASTECGLEHLWEVSYRRSKNRVVKTTKELLENYIHINKKGETEYWYDVEYCSPVNYLDRQYFIDPYTLGVLIGDGSLTANRVIFSCSDVDKEIVEKVNSKLHRDYHLNINRYPSCPQYYLSLNKKRLHKTRVNKYLSEIKRLALNVKSHEKYIPEEYMLGSVQQRKELLAGLLDTDGSCQKRSKKSSTTYSSVSKQLILDIQQLVFSLGGSATVRSYKRENKRTEYNVSIRLDFNPFKLSRKAKNFVAFKYKNTITKIEKSRMVDTQCIKVENTDQLYLTQNYIVTHNTSILSMVCKVLSNDKILIMNGQNFILQQVYERLLLLGVPEEEISFVKGGTPDFSKRIVIYNAKGSNNRLREQNEDYVNYLKTVNVWITDECQHIQALTCFEPVLYMDPNNLKHIIGYTGSAFRNHTDPYTNTQDLLTIAILGEPKFKYEMKDTIEDGNIAQPYAYFIRYANKKAYVRPEFEKNYFIQYKMNITYNKPRNTAGKEMLKFLNKHGVKTMASYTAIKPGLNMLKELKLEGVDSIFVSGGGVIQRWVWEKGKRKDKLVLETLKGDIEYVKKELETINIVAASQVFNEGIDIDIFQAVVLFAAGKSPISNIQRIGRASRKKKTGKNIAFVIDFRDTDGYYAFQDQYNKRKRLMEDSGIKTITDVQEFCKMIMSLNE